MKIEMKDKMHTGSIQYPSTDIVLYKRIDSC